MRLRKKIEISSISSGKACVLYIRFLNLAIMRLSSLASEFDEYGEILPYFTIGCQSKMILFAPFQSPSTRIVSTGARRDKLYNSNYLIDQSVLRFRKWMRAQKQLAHEGQSWTIYEIRQLK